MLALANHGHIWEWTASVRFPYRSSGHIVLQQSFPACVVNREQGSGKIKEALTVLSCLGNNRMVSARLRPCRCFFSCCCSSSLLAFVSLRFLDADIFWSSREALAWWFLYFTKQNKN